MNASVVADDAKTPATGPPVRRIVAEPLLNAEQFEPFGWLLGAHSAEPLPIDLYGGRDDNIPVGTVDCDHPVELIVLRSKFRGFRINYLERHFELAQSFIPIGGNPLVLVVAPPGAPEVDGLPAFPTVRAFVVPGTLGVTLRRGTWHEPPFPLVHGSTTLITMHHALSEALASARDEMGEIHHGDVDKRNVTLRSGVELHVALP